MISKPFSDSQPMDLTTLQLQQRTRRFFFKESAAGLGAIALSDLLEEKTLPPLRFPWRHL